MRIEPGDFVRADGTPLAYGTVLQYVVSRLHAASKKGRGIRLSREEVRALDWAVIREHGGLNTDLWRETRPPPDTINALEGGGPRS